MNVTQLAIEKNRITGAVIAIILAGGASAYFAMSRAEDPGFTIRTALVSTLFPGASPERMELLITDKLEKVIQEIPQLKVVTSESKTGMSIIYVQIEERYTEMRPIWDDLRRKVAGAQPTLPTGVIGPFVNDEFGDVFGTVMTIAGEGYTYAELKDIADDVRDELLRIDEVAKVNIYGAQEERIFVEYANAPLAAVGLSPAQLQAILEARNIIIPGGYIRTGEERIALEPSGNFDSVEELRRTVINLPNRPDVVYLEDIATVRRGYIDPPETKVTASGESPALALGISMRDGGNIIALGEAFLEVYQRLQAVYPWGVEFDIVSFQPQAVEESVNGFVGSVMQSVGIVVIVMLLTLGFRTGLVVASLIPVTMIMALMVMNSLNIGLDQMSLAALIIALGLLVDNSIVMSESIMVQMAAGKARMAAAVDSANELRVPLLTSSVTTAAAFLPIFLAESSAGEYTAPIFKVVAITLLCSWILSITMIPMLCFYFLRIKSSSTDVSFTSPYYRRYRELLIAALRHPYLSVGAAVGIFALAMVGFRFIPNIFFPPSAKPIVSADLTLPTGTPIERTEEVARTLEAFVRDELAVDGERSEGIVNWASFIGGGAPRYVLTYNAEPPTPEDTYILMNATSRAMVDDLIPRLEEFAQRTFPDVTAKFSPSILGPPVTAPIEVRLSGPELDMLFGLVDEVTRYLGSLRGTRNIVDDWGRRTKKLLVNVNQPRARRAGVSSRDVAVSLQTVLSGFQTTQYREGTDVIPVTLRSVAADREDIGKIESLNIFAQATGSAVPLKQVADVEVVWEPAKILRRDRSKTVTVQADLAPGLTVTDINSRLIPWLEEQSQSWPFGYRFEMGGELEASVESQRSIGAKVPLAALIIVVLLIGQFNSIRRPLIIFLTIPLGLIGVVIGLIIARSYFGFITLLGVVALAGIVINNAIVLLDRIRIEIEENGLEPRRAVVEAAQRRLRPILLTTATTIGGLIPLWFGGGPLFEPMAIAIIFGLAFATILTVGLVPVLYSIFFGVRFKDFTYTTPSTGSTAE